MPYELVKCPTNTKIEYKCVPLKTPPTKSKTISKKVKSIRISPTSGPSIVSSTRRRCPNGTRKNKKTGKCESKIGASKYLLKSKTQAKKLRAKKLRAKKLRKTIKLVPTKKTAPSHVFFDDDKTISSTKLTPDILTIKSETPKINRQLGTKLYDLTFSKKKSYTPEINRLMIDEITKTKRRDLFECPKPIDQVKIKQKSGKYKCVGIESKSAQKQLLKFLNRPRVADCITAPKQHRSNCWFNALLMTMFISDKGYKFMKPIRQIMITGTRLNGTKLHKPFHRALLEFNSAIQASIDCVDPNFLLLLDTNEIIFEMHRTLLYDLDWSKQELLHDVVRVDQAGNPIYYYIALIHALLGDTTRDTHIYNANPSMSLKNIQNIGYNPDIIVRGIADNSKYNTKPQKPEIFKVEGHTYKLDSVVLRDNSKAHFSCYITINGEEYAFDGMTFSRLSKFKWRTLLHKNKDFKFDDIDVRLGSELTFNFKKGYQMLLYYRID